MIDIRRARLRLASTLILSQYSRQLKAISIMSWLSKRCWDFSFVKITIKDLIRASLSSLLDCENSFLSIRGRKELPERTPGVAYSFGSLFY